GAGPPPARARAPARAALLDRRRALRPLPPPGPSAAHPVVPRHSVEQSRSSPLGGLPVELSFDTRRARAPSCAGRAFPGSGRVGSARARPLGVRVPLALGPPLPRPPLGGQRGPAPPTR